jgi:hypothetical protein
VAKDQLDPAILDGAIEAALHKAPRVTIPEGFAARLAKSLPPQPARRLSHLTPAHYGVRAAVLCLFVLTGLMLASAKAGAHSPTWLFLESVFCAQFVVLAVWLTARRYRFPGSL